MAGSPPDPGPEQQDQQQQQNELRPGDKILVTVEAALPDIVVVSLERGPKRFQGALLDATKRGLPCGVQPPEPIKGPDSDKLATIAARFSYFQEKRPIVLAKTDQRLVNPPPRSKNSRPTVRLRPRQVLCSKCQSICNENSENVGRKRKLDDSGRSEQPTRRSDRRCNSLQQQQQRHPPQHQQNTRSQRLLHVNEQSDESSSSKTSTSTTTTTNSSRSDQRTTFGNNFGSSLIPKLSRLTPTEIGSAIHAGSAKSCAKLTEQRRSAFWDGRDEEADLEEADAEVENRPMNAMPQSEPVELDSNPSQTYRATPRRLSSSSVESAKIPLDEDDKKTLAAADSTVKSVVKAGRVPRKKRSVGLMEDLWDESVFEDPARTAAATRATPVIKISFGAQGEGTVLKIPSKIQHQYLGQDADTDNEEMQLEPERDPLELPGNHDHSAPDEYAQSKCALDESNQEHSDLQKFGSPARDCETASSKAAKKALKKAKKKALRKMWEISSPTRSPCNGSPRYYPNFDKLLYHRRKHKVKHKKKHKEERKHKSQSEPDAFEAATTDCSIARPLDGPPSCPESVVVDLDDQQAQENGSAYTAIKEQCLKQKLSISLKRLNTNAYAARCEHNGYAVSNASSGCKSPGATSDEEDEDVDVEEGCLGQEAASVSETTPNFSPSEHPLVVRLAATAAPVESHCSSSAARRMDVGDVVWGKVHGFPWWPAKVLSITDDSFREDGSSSGPQAHVAWYGSSTRSFMSCDQLSPFLETFKTRYNKKKKGPYKEAIRQAQNEARNQLAPNTAGSVLDVCGSPREVNVLS